MASEQFNRRGLFLVIPAKALDPGSSEEATWHCREVPEKQQPQRILPRRLPGNDTIGASSGKVGDFFIRLKYSKNGKSQTEG